jgi:hypothetical protein
MMISSEESDRIEMNREERDRLKVLHGVRQGERTQKEAARLLRLTVQLVLTDSQGPIDEPQRMGDGLPFDYRTHRTIWSLGEEFKLWGTITSHPEYNGTVVYRTASIMLTPDKEQVFDSGLKKTEENFLGKLYAAYQKLQTLRFQQVREKVVEEMSRLDREQEGSFLSACSFALVLVYFFSSFSVSNLRKSSTGLILLSTLSSIT